MKQGFPHLPFSHSLCVYRLITAIDADMCHVLISSFCQVFSTRRNHRALVKIVPDMISHLMEHVSISVMTPLSGSTNLASIHLPLTQIVCFGALGFFLVLGSLLLVSFFSFIIVLFSFISLHL